MVTECWKWGLLKTNTKRKKKYKWDRGTGVDRMHFFFLLLYSTSYVAVAVSVAPFSFLFRYIIYQGTFYSHHLLSLFPWQYYRWHCQASLTFFFRYISIYTKCDEILYRFFVCFCFHLGLIHLLLKTKLNVSSLIKKKNLNTLNGYDFKNNKPFYTVYRIFIGFFR